MGRLAHIFGFDKPIFGFDKRKLWFYRDVALTVVAAIMTLRVIGRLTTPVSPFPRRLAVLYAAIAILCWAFVRNRLLMFATLVGFVALQGWIAVLFTDDPRIWWITVPATLVLVGILYKFRNKPIIRK
jgi:hypothetical protein